MAGHKRPSFLKKQKEQQRKTRANEKREAKRVRKETKAAQGVGPDVQELELDGIEQDSPEEEMTEQGEETEH
jgi:hypothetical protein